MQPKNEPRLYRLVLVVVCLVVVYTVWSLIWWGFHGQISYAPRYFADNGVLNWLRAMKPFIEWLGPTATVLAVVAALGVPYLQQAILQRSNRANLSVEVLPAISIQWKEKGQGRPSQARHYRLAIKAESPAAGKNVEVVVFGAWDRGRKAQWWTPLSMKWSDGDYTIRPILSSNTTRHCDFLMMVEPSSQVEDILLGLGSPLAPRGDVTAFRFDNDPCLKVMSNGSPNGGLNLLLSSPYTLGVEVSAENVKPTLYYFDVSYGPRWEDAVTIVRRDDPPRD